MQEFLINLYKQLFVNQSIYKAVEKSNQQTSAPQHQIKIKYHLIHKSGCEKEKLFDNDMIDKRMSIREGQLFDISPLRANLCGQLSNNECERQKFINKTKLHTFTSLLFKIKNAIIILLNSK